MSKRLRIDLLHIFSLLCILFLSLNIFPGTRQFLYFYTKPVFQLEVVFILMLLYVGFALIYHKRDKSLTFETASEYILIALLILIILTGAY